MPRIARFAAALIAAWLLGGPAGAADGPEVGGLTPLLRAVQHDDLAAARALLVAGADADRANRYGVTALSLACERGAGPLVAELLAAGADPGRALPGGETPLHTAARTGRPEPVRALLAAGARVDAALPDGQTPLMWAAAEGHVEVVRLLLAAGADLHRRVPSGFNAWLFAVRGGHAETARVLLAAGADLHYGVLPEPGHRGRKHPAAGTSALLLAIENGHFELAAELVDRGADPDDLRSGFAPLHVLTWVRKPDISEANGDPPPDGSGSLSSSDLARHLVARGADVNLRLERGPARRGRYAQAGATPLVLAADRADLAYVRLLVELGADPAIPTVEGATALMTAAGLGNGPDQDEAGTDAEAVETVAFLLDLGLDPNARTTTGETAMHGAAYAGFPRVAKLLGERGGRIDAWNVPNAHGWTPLRIAEGHRFGNFKPSFETIDAIKLAMLAHGAEIPPPMKRELREGY